MQVLEHAAYVQLRQLVMQHTHDTAEDQQREQRRNPAQAAAIARLTHHLYGRVQA